MIRPFIVELTESSSAGATLIGSLLLAIWSSSKYIGAFGRALNAVYRVEETRPYWKLKPLMLLMTVVTWPVFVFFVMLLIALLYYVIPNVRQPKFRWVSLGAFVALLVLLAVSACFVLYINNFSSYNVTYGSIGGVTVGLAWVWMVNLSLLLGAEFDAEIERREPCSIVQHRRPGVEEAPPVVPMKSVWKCDRQRCTRHFGDDTLLQLVWFELASSRVLRIKTDSDEVAICKEDRVFIELFENRFD
ncbi:YihY/virulence factor BrkB family protein [Brevibacterium permense]|uniref:YihY/virulence factor BrkB family protein n=1 Tax=Brevibacterium permense TaxID=234834 RepID=UPI0021D01B46|nr:YihY/virulence factor BrkB family protein [Brevibacterium permense]